MKPFIITAALAVSAAAGFASPITYAITPIPAPAGLTMGNAYGINDSGEVAGTAYTNYVNPHYAFIYNGTTSTVVPMPSGYTQSAGYGINASGELVGFVTNGAGNQGFISNGSTSTVIPAPTGSQNSEAEGINNAGDVTGFGYNGTTQAFVSDSSNTNTIPPPGGMTNLSAYGINNSGEVVGYGGIAGDNSQAFIYNGTTATAIPLPTGWNWTYGYAINDLGQVAGVGQSIVLDEAFFYDGTSSSVIPLPPGATQAHVTLGSLNNASQVVGTSDVGGWIWDATDGTILLNTEVPTGWNITNAVSISDNGLILAYGTYNNGPGEWVELHPSATPEPGTCILVGAGLAAVADRRPCVRHK